MRILKINLFKIIFFLLLVICVTFLGTNYGTEKVYAINPSGNGSVDLTLFVTPLTAKSQAGFPISTGEFIQYALIPNDVAGQTIRMFKNTEKTNWEQFVNEGGFIRRREDTSWAPIPQGEPGAPDVFCVNGHRAVYTLVNDGQAIIGNAKWLPQDMNFTSFTADHDARDITIQPVDRTAMDARVGCTLSGSLAPIYPASGQRQKMKLTYHPSGSFIFCSGRTNDEDLIDVLVTEGFGSGDHFYYMKNWGFVGFQDPTGRNAGLCTETGECGSCATSGGSSLLGDGFLDTTNPPPQEPECTNGMYELTIKGTVKSDRIYLYDISPMTNEPVYQPYVYGTQSDMPRVNNLPVYHAVVQLHNSYKERSQITVTGDWSEFDYSANGESGSGSLGREEGAEHSFHTGLVDGMLKQSYKWIKTNADGTFEIKAVNSCGENGDVFRDNWKGRGYEQFLSISCADKPDSMPAGLYQRDTYGIILDLPLGSEDGVVNIGDINVSCDRDPEGTYGVFNPTGVLGAQSSGEVLGTSSGSNLNIMYRNRDVYMSCSGTRKLGNTYTSDHWNQGVVFDDTPSEDGGRCSLGPGFIQCIIDSINNLLKGLFERFGGTIPFGDWTHIQTETRTELNGYGYDLTNTSILLDMMTGSIKAGDVKRARYFGPYATIPSGVETYAGSREEKAKVYTCEEIRRTNMGIGDEAYPDENMQTGGGTSFTLSPPFGGKVRDATGNVVIELSGYLARWLNTAKTGNPEGVCTDESGNPVQIADIMPPEGYCGDVDENGTMSGGELPCPITWSCGDQNGNGLNPAEGEVDCTTVPMQPGSPDHTYKYDVRYFPYYTMFTALTKNYANSRTSRTYTQGETVGRAQGDSYHSMCPRGLAPNEEYVPGADPSGISKPMSTTCVYGAGSDTFYTQEEQKFPGDQQTNYINTFSFGSPKLAPYYSGWQTIGTPISFDDITATNPVQAVEESVSGMLSTLSATKKAKFFRIGVPDDLCSCSLVEMNGSTSLGDCSAEGGPLDPPNPKEPSNMFNIARDEEINGSYAGNYKDANDNPLWSSNIYNPEGNASSTGGGADWTWENIFNGDKKWTHGGDNKDEDLHYSQPITSAISILKTIGEYISCTVSSHESNNPILDAIGKIIGTDFGKIPSAECSRVVKILTQNKTLTGWEPDYFEEGPLVFAESLFPPEYQMNHELPSSVGLEMAVMTKAQKNPATESSNNMPGNQGTGTSNQRGADYVDWYNKLSNLVKQPTFAGGFTSQCHMVPGWQVVQEPSGMLFTADCLQNGSTCWVGGVNWSGPTLIMSSNNGGLSWLSDPISGTSGFVHGISAYTGLQIGTGGGGRSFFANGASWSRSTSFPFLMSHPRGEAPDSPEYTGYTYDIAGTLLGGYLTTATGYVFYSGDGGRGSGWKDIHTDDIDDGDGVLEPGERLGCESRDYPYGCVSFERDINCTVDGAGGTSVCCCSKDGGTLTVHYDPSNNKYCSPPGSGQPYPPNCTGIKNIAFPICPAGGTGYSDWQSSCWLWGNSSISGVDCEETTGDCLVAGQKSDKAWYGRNTGLGSLGEYSSWTRYDPSTDGHAMNVSFPSPTVAYIVGANDDDPDYPPVGGVVPTKGAYIIKLTRTSRSEPWQLSANIAPAGAPGFFGIDCFSPNDCAVAGTDGTVFITEDGGATWKDWETLWPGDEKIAQAKSSGVHFWDIAYPNKNTIIAVGYKGTGTPGVIYALGEREVCDEPEDGGGDDGGDDGDSNATFSLDRCDCNGMAVSASPTTDWTFGDLNMEIKSTSGGSPVCQTGCYWTGGCFFTGAPFSLPCAVPAGEYKCWAGGNLAGLSPSSVEEVIHCP